MTFCIPDFIMLPIPVCSVHHIEASSALVLPPSLILMYSYIFFFLHHRNLPFSLSFAYDNTHNKGCSIFFLFKKIFSLCPALSLIFCHRAGKYIQPSLWPQSTYSSTEVLFLLYYYLAFCETKSGYYNKPFFFFFCLFSSESACTPKHLKVQQHLLALAT